MAARCKLCIVDENKPRLFCVGPSNDFDTYVYTKTPQGITH